MNDLRAWKPESGNEAILLQLLIGEAGADGEDSFDLTLCGLAWFSERVSESGFLEGRHYLVFAEYDFGAIEAYLSRRISEFSAESWPELAAKLAQIGAWEFADYSEFHE